VGTLYQPQLRSAPGAPHPVFLGLLDAAHAAMSARVTTTRRIRPCDPGRRPTVPERRS
jgi:hypothetical protein